MRATIWIVGSGLLFGAMSALRAQDNTSLDQASPQAHTVESTATQRGDSSRRLAPRNEKSWMAMIVKNYPIHAHLHGQEGTVGVAVSVSRDGRPTDCRVTKSSGHELLDSAACKGMQRYARFDPALDADGRPITAEFSSEVTFALDQEK